MTRGVNKVSVPPQIKRSEDNRNLKDRNLIVQSDLTKIAAQTTFTQKIKTNDNFEIRNRYSLSKVKASTDKKIRRLAWKTKLIQEKV